MRYSQSPALCQPKSSPACAWPWNPAGLKQVAGTTSRGGRPSGSVARHPFPKSAVLQGAVPGTATARVLRSRGIVESGTSAAAAPAPPLYACAHQLLLLHSLCDPVTARLQQCWKASFCVQACCPTCHPGILVTARMERHCESVLRSWQDSEDPHCFQAAQASFSLGSCRSQSQKLYSRNH